MAEATDVPTDETRALLRRAAEAGLAIEPIVQWFVGVVRTAIGSFERELRPLDLSEDDYERVVNESGLRLPNEVISRIETVFERIDYL